ncbi:hypothetical protein TBLA_0C01830 [Henningerozyma blattae CBS 6284]|uniref:TRUD domain-containing protein n=1 Tax=Henningerozyma blattae (strain ATCC 34711 / CBS 6284 / DSM 70876 / NBRC 10599 / NRRL Y-10934 / UCD 77-7) TaxID=1071380 RepID=I2H0U4_HENB6|nr:hypothetical protein TBLA_0C01830 [Tetrapisispora blattae CBS 6284]CCH59996.1 hypothetical protein TBLA_0C01830 [Tetrapisispora blattae CBS 6284]
MSEIQDNPAKRSLEETQVENSVSKKARVNVVDNGISEADVGITYFLSPEICGFKGQIKQRYTDFLVNEIDKQGNVVNLTDKGFNMPKKAKQSPEENKKNREEELAKRHSFTPESESRAQLVELLGEEDVSKIEEVYREAVSMETTKTFDDKTERTKIHHLLRAAFNNELESVTTDSNSFKIARSNNKSRVNKKELVERTKDANGVENWGYGPTKEFLHFTLHKENKDTMDAVNIIAKLLRFPTRVIRFAGTKDRRGVTCQRLSISKLSVDRLNALNRTLKGMTVGGFKYEDVSLNLGELQGNEFVIVIRDVQVNEDSSMTLEDILDKGCKSLTNNGFINYFGMQRFGTFSVSTHEIGKELLNENWENAVELILSEQTNVQPKSIEARKIWAETKDAKEALKKMPRQCLAENAVLHFLSSQALGEDGKYSANAYYTAIMKIPRNLRTMYVHAYQSYVWNAVASKRIELYGLKLVPGDLVVNDEEQIITEEKEEEFDEDLREADFVRAKAVTQEDIDQGKYTIDDMILPTPGFDVIYPTDEKLKELYVELMKKDGMNPFEMRRKVRDFSLAGTYRVVINKPKELEYNIIKYETDTQQLINSDLEILNNKRGKENGQKYMKDKLQRISKEKGGDKVAVILKFQLGISAYATMLLRELMKLETSRRGDMCDVTVQNSVNKEEPKIN